jgi:hypothetical protein
LTFLVRHAALGIRAGMPLALTVGVPRFRRRGRLYHGAVETGLTARGSEPASVIADQGHSREEGDSDMQRNYVSSMARRSLLPALAVTFAFASVAPLATAQPPISRTLWAVPYPFGASKGQQLAFSDVNGPVRSLSLPVGANTEHRVRRLRWSRWGARTVTARGRARYCTKAGCGPIRSVKITLLRRVTKPCGEGRVRQYEQYRVKGFRYMNSTRRYPSGPGPCGYGQPPA